MFTGERKRSPRKNYVPLLSPFSSFPSGLLTQNYSLIFRTKDVEFILQASTKQNTLTSRTLKDIPSLALILYTFLFSNSDCKVKKEKEKGQSDLFSLFSQIPAKNGKWGQNPCCKSLLWRWLTLMKVANGQNILTLFWTLRQLFSHQL